jgi:hypothetical protein
MNKTIRDKLSKLQNLSCVDITGDVKLTPAAAVEVFEVHDRPIVSCICTALLVGQSRDQFLVVSRGIFSVATDRTMCPGVDSASKDKYQGFLLG